MLNQIILVGRLTSDIEVVEGENGTKYANITLAIPRNYKNEKGEYDTDFVSVIAYDNIAKNTSDYCKKGDIVGVKGRVAKLSNDESMTIICEKLTFLSSEKKLQKTKPESANGVELMASVGCLV